MLRTNFADILFKIASSSSANSKLISSFMLLAVHEMLQGSSSEMTQGASKL
jgi:hypothetical protein